MLHNTWWITSVLFAWPEKNANLISTDSKWIILRTAFNTVNDYLPLLVFDTASPINVKHTNKANSTSVAVAPYQQKITFKIKWMVQNYVKKVSLLTARIRTGSLLTVSEQKRDRDFSYQAIYIVSLFCLHELPWWSSLILRQSTCTALPWPPATLATSRDNSLWHTHASFSNLDIEWLAYEPTFCIIHFWHGNRRYGFNSITDEYTFLPNSIVHSIFIWNHLARIFTSHIQSKLVQWKVENTCKTKTFPST